MFDYRFIRAINLINQISEVRLPTYELTEILGEHKNTIHRLGRKLSRQGIIDARTGTEGGYLLISARVTAIDICIALDLPTRGLSPKILNTDIFDIIITPPTHKET